VQEEVVKPIGDQHLETGPSASVGIEIRPINLLPFRLSEPTQRGWNWKTGRSSSASPIPGRTVSLPLLTLTDDGRTNSPSRWMCR
jgi:hypothetical protein